MKYHVFEKGFPFNANLKDHVVNAGKPVVAAAIYATVSMGAGYCERPDYLDVFDTSGKLVETVRVPDLVDAAFVKAMAAAFTKEVRVVVNPADTIQLGEDGQPLPYKKPEANPFGF